MSFAARLRDWIRRRVGKRQGTGSSESLGLGLFVRRRFAQVDGSVPWPGRDVLVRIGQLEHSLRRGVDDLTRIELSSSSASRRAREIRQDVEAVLDPQGRFAQLVHAWPARWGDLSSRFQDLEGELRSTLMLATTLLETAQRARACHERYERLGRRHAEAQPALWQRLDTELDLRSAIGRIETALGASSASHRLDMAEEILSTDERRLMESREGLTAAMAQCGYAIEAADHEPLEIAVHRMRTALPPLCDGSVRTAGQSLSGAAQRHLKRLANPTERVLRTRVMKSLGLAPEGPLLYWARLHHATVRGLRETLRQRKEAR